MSRVKLVSAALSLDNPDVLSLYAQLIAGEKFQRSFGKCPVCSNDKATMSIVCMRPYCKQVWKLARGLYRLAPTLDEKKTPRIIAPKPVKKKPTQAKPVPVMVPPSGRPSEVERWLSEHNLVDCPRMSARLAASSCGMNWRCFKPSRCASVPDGATCPPIPDNWGM